MTVKHLEQLAAERNVAQRDCRDCSQFEDQDDSLGYGWCRAHDQFVKLYVGSFWSQCQFKALARERT